MYARVLSVICVLLATATVTQSRRWYATEVSCWITQKKVPATWEDARRRCERNGAVLASPLNTQLHNYLQSRLNVQNNSVAYFIGTRANHSDDGQEVHYVSVEGRRLEDMPMAVFDAIQQLDLKQGDCLSMDRHGIRAVSCWEQLPYICYSNETMKCGSALATAPAPSTTTSATTSTRPLTLTIPPGYTYYPATGSYYKFHERWVTWDVANTTCASEGAYLVVLNDAAEVDIVARIVTDAGVQALETWIGLRNGGVLDWRTVRGEPISDVFNVWSDGLPRECGYLYIPDKRLRDWSCGGFSYATCEITQQ